MQAQTGIIGVGLMGHGIARNILRSSRQLGFYRHPGNQPVDDLLADGAMAYDDMRSLASDCESLILCVTGSPQVREIICGDDGLLGVLGEHHTIIDCSTSLPAVSRELADRLAAVGAGFLDAPMTRTPREAEAGRLNLIVGGDPDRFEQQRPLLSSFAENISYAGEVGAGHAMKLIHNFVSLGYSAVLAEASALALSAGIDRSVLLDVLGNGGGAGVVLDRLSPYLREGDDSAFRFSLANAHKDLGYYLQMAADLQANTRAAEVIKALYSDAEQAVPDGTVPQLISLLGRR